MPRNRGTNWLTKPLTKKRAKRQAKMVARLATRPEKRAIKGEIRASRVQDDRIDSYFSQYGDALAKIAQTTGGSVDGTVGAAQQSYMAEKMRIAEREKIEMLNQEHSRRMSLRADKRALVREGGDLRREEFARLRDTERDFMLGLKAARQPGLERKFEKRESRKSRKHDIRLDKQDNRQEKAAERRERRFALNHPEAAGSSSGGGENKPEKGDLRQALAYLRQADKGSYTDRKSAVDYLINRNVDPRVARAAVRRAGGKKPNKKKLRRYDVGSDVAQGARQFTR